MSKSSLACPLVVLATALWSYRKLDDNASVGGKGLTTPASTDNSEDRVGHRAEMRHKRWLPWRFMAVFCLAPSACIPAPL